MSKLKLEFFNLNKNIADTDDYLRSRAREFWDNGGVCCPTCGVEGYGELEIKQENRWKRRKELIVKLKEVFGEDWYKEE